MWELARFQCLQLREEEKELWLKKQYSKQAGNCLLLDQNRSHLFSKPITMAFSYNFRHQMPFKTLQTNQKLDIFFSFLYINISWYIVKKSLNFINLVINPINSRKICHFWFFFQFCLGCQKQTDYFHFFDHDVIVILIFFVVLEFRFCFHFPESNFFYQNSFSNLGFFVKILL